jgi:hypothetical protein
MCRAIDDDVGEFELQFRLACHRVSALVAVTTTNIASKIAKVVFFIDLHSPRGGFRDPAGVL